jgi:hypothetical protein
MIYAPIVSDKTPYQKPEGGEERRQPRPESSRVGPAETARWIGALGIGHVPFPFLGPTNADRQCLLPRNVPDRTCYAGRSMTNTKARTSPGIAEKMKAPAAGNALQPSHTTADGEKLLQMFIESENG